MRKIDARTGEEFECEGDSGDCWCRKLPHIPELNDPLESDCMGPSRLNMRVDMLRAASGPKRRVQTPEGKDEDVWHFPAREEFLRVLLTDLFERYYDKLCWGTFLPGVAYELKASGRPKEISVEGGYLTVHWGDKGHFHLCIGDIQVPPGRPDVAARVAAQRPSRAEFYRTLDRDGFPHTWGLRLFNGKGELLIAIFFPNPYVTDDDKVTSEPDWSRITLWEELLPRYTGHRPDGLDRQGRGFARY